MKKHEIIGVLIVLFLGLGILFFLPDIGGKNGGETTAVIQDYIDTESTATATGGETAVYNPTVSNEDNQSESNDEPIIVETDIPILVAEPSGKDIADVLLLYNSGKPNEFDVNFCRVAGFYGLGCDSIDLEDVLLDDDDLRDANGQYYKLVGIAGSTLTPGMMREEDLKTLMDVVENEGINIIVSKINEFHKTGLLTTLTSDKITGVSKPQDEYPDWYFSTDNPEITREFTGQTITINKDSRQNDYALSIQDADAVTSVIEATDDFGSSYTLFAFLELGMGRIFLDAGQRAPSLDENQLTTMYYEQRDFSQIIPLMFTMRYTLQDEVWHNDRNFVNFMIDDPPLRENLENHSLLKYMNFLELFQEMEAHDFHTTIAFPAHYWETSEPDVIRLFLSFPNRYSLVQHGNNHDGFEFYKYEVEPTDDKPARPLAEQEKDIIEGRARMEQHRYRTGIPYGSIMVFPYGSAPVPTFELLKKYNFLAVMHTSATPIDATPSARWDYNMQPASMDYANFAMVRRRQIPAWDTFYDPLYPVYELFLDKPAILITHVASMFVEGMDAFNPIADQINNIEGGVEWQSPDYILKRLYLEKLNDDGSLDIEMYTRLLILENESDSEQVYHISKEEALNIPILSVTVNGEEFPYRVEDGLLQIDLIIPSQTEAEITIMYDERS